MPRQAPEMKATSGSIADAHTRDRALDQNNDQAQDQEYMVRALQLAAQGQGLASPNPMVGAVVVRNARVVAEAFHTYDGLRHAEIIALEAAGENARGATLYINLEPCCHTGRTGPCTRALISAGIARVVAAMRDPNPRVAGRGFQELRAAGIRVDGGADSNPESGPHSDPHVEKARRLNEAFAWWIRKRRPLVTLKTALTLDGSLVLPRSRNGNQPRWITSEISRAEVHRMRHASDAIMTGIGTILADDPLLTDRSGLPRRRPLLRVILDSRLRLSPKSQVVRSAQGDVLVFTCASASSARAKNLSAHGAKIFHLRARRSRPDMQTVLEELGRRDILSVMLEAGPLLNQAALEADVVEKVRLFYAPTLVGLGSSLPGLASRKRARAFRVRELSGIRTENFGPDFAVEGYLRDVYRDR
jgi:diaminohydroxyphosphoribosylaminopyrimidine deaminase/5-amino-6-(5-phosphoribosylamino)uracil reductase